jgi:hypothetical protein
MNRCATLFASELANQPPNVYVNGRKAILPRSCRMRARLRIVRIRETSVSTTPTAEATINARAMSIRITCAR